MENDVAQPATSETIGAYLRALRVMDKISLEEVSESTGISTSVISALENEDREQLPAEVYIKAFYKKYAEYLGLDPEEVMGKYEQQTGKDQKKSGRKADFSTVVTLKGHEESLIVGVFRKLFLPIVILGLGLLLYWVYRTHLAPDVPVGFFHAYSHAVSSLMPNASCFSLTC